MAATHTTNLNLNKPDRQDFVSVVADINDNMDIIDTAVGNLDTDKVNVSDIVDNLTTNDSMKPLSAAQGYVLNSDKISYDLALTTVFTGDAYSASAGLYRCTSSATNIPVAANGYLTVIVRANDTKYLQYVTDSGRTFANTMNGATWTGWNELALDSKLSDSHRVIQSTNGVFPSTGNTYLDNAINNFASNIADYTNGNTYVVNSSGGPYFFFRVAKYTGQYYTAIVDCYNSELSYPTSLIKKSGNNCEIVYLSRI